MGQYHTPIADFSEIRRMINYSGLQDDVKNIPEIRELAKEGLIKSVLNPGYTDYVCWLDSVIEYQKLFDLPELDNIFEQENLLKLVFGQTTKEEVNSNFSYLNHVKPILAAQGDGASSYLKAIKNINNFQNISIEDADYITHVAKKYGTQARNILENILSNTHSISGERTLVEEYLDKVGIPDANYYSEYKKIKESGDVGAIDTMKEKITTLQNKIYKGEMEEKDFSDEICNAVSFYTFPPATGLTQSQYSQLNKNRTDRRADVPESLDSLQYERFEITTGRYMLDSEKELNLEEWDALSKVIKKVNQELQDKGDVEINEEEIGVKIIDIYQNKKQNTNEGRDSLFEEMYRYHLIHGGGKLESGYEISIEGLMKYKEFIGDRIKNDLIKDCLSEWRAKHAEEYEALKKETLNRLKQNENQNFAKVKNMTEAIRKQKDKSKKATAIEKLDDFLRDFGLSYDSIKDMEPKRLQIELGSIEVEYEGDITEDNYHSEEYYNSDAFIKAYDELMSRYDQDALVVQKISSDLVAGINKKMRKEMDKFEFHGGSGNSESRELEFVISKKKEHGVVGYNMGVCVTPDEKLWNDPQFMNAIIFDPKLKQAMGGMHFLIRENCLCLPGINPSLDVLSHVDNEKLFNQMIAYAKKVKEKLGLEKILIPTSSGIHSNRNQIHDIIRKKNYKTVSLEKEAEFSYKPYQYSFEECFEVA